MLTIHACFLVVTEDLGGSRDQTGKSALETVVYSIELICYPSWPRWSGGTDL